jgi:hypothetical protein
MPGFTRDDSATLDPPVGWSWHTRPSFDEFYNDPVAGTLNIITPPTTLAEAKAAVRAAYTWAESFLATDPDKIMLLEISANGDAGDFRYPRQFQVYLNYQMNDAHYSAAVTCSCGTHTTPWWEEQCPGGCGRELRCETCNSFVRRILTWDETTEAYYCNACTRACAFRVPPTPGGIYATRCQRRFFGADFQYCEEHGDRTQCSGCERMAEKPLMFEVSSTALYCSQCSPRVCRHCGSLSPQGTTMREHALLDMLLCPGCYTEFESAGTDEEFDGDDPGPSALLLTNNQHRPVRICSVELECTSGKALQRRSERLGSAR